MFAILSPTTLHNNKFNHNKILTYGPEYLQKFLPSYSFSIVLKFLKLPIKCLFSNTIKFPAQDCPSFASVSVHSKCQHLDTPGHPPGFCKKTSSQVPGFPPSELPRGCLGSDLLSIVKVQSCQLMLHGGIFQLQTYLPSIAAFLMQNLFQSWGENFKNF